MYSLYIYSLCTALYTSETISHFNSLCWHIFICVLCVDIFLYVKRMLVCPVNTGSSWERDRDPHPSPQVFFQEGCHWNHFKILVYVLEFGRHYTLIYATLLRNRKFQGLAEATSGCVRESVAPVDDRSQIWVPDVLNLGKRLGEPEITQRILPKRASRGVTGEGICGGRIPGNSKSMVDLQMAPFTNASPMSGTSRWKNTQWWVWRSSPKNSRSIPQEG